MDIYRLMEESRIRFRTTAKPIARWKIFRRCNYKCPYCSVTKHQKYEPSDLDPNRLVSLVLNFMPKNWCIELTGGEPTIDIPFLTTFIKAIAKARHEIRLVSNMSASVRDYLVLEDESNGYLRSLFLTYHPAMVSEKHFLDKAKRLWKLLPLSCEIRIRQVILPTKSSIEKFLSFRNVLRQSNLDMVSIKLLIVKGQSHFRPDYGGKLKNLSDKVFQNRPNFPNRKGTYCPAGYEYVCIGPDLSVYTCIPYKRDPDGYLGNLYLGNAEINNAPKLCNKDFCYCGVPGR